MVKQELPKPREVTENMIAVPTQKLLPHAVHHAMMSSRTPLLWCEGRCADEPHRFGFFLMVKLGEKTIHLTLNLCPAGQDESGLWRLAIGDEKPAGRDIHYMETSLILSPDRGVEVKRITQGRVIESNFLGEDARGGRDSALEENRDEFLICYIRKTLDDAAANAPNAQKQSLRKQGWPDLLENGSKSVRTLGSAATKNALTSMGIKY